MEQSICDCIVVHELVGRVWISQPDPYFLPVVDVQAWCANVSDKPAAHMDVLSRSPSRLAASGRNSPS